MKTPGPTYSNCLFAALCLVLRGRARRVALVSSHAWWLPCHIVIVTPAGHALHFRYRFEQVPLWFVGRLEGVRRSQIDRVLERERRKVLCTLPPWSFAAASGLVILLMVVPWVVFWIAWPIASAVQTLLRRWSK